MSENYGIDKLMVCDYLENTLKIAMYIAKTVIRLLYNSSQMNVLIILATEITRIHFYFITFA